MKDKILKLLGEKGDLPPLPEILLKLEKLIGDPDSDIEAIAELIETEPVLSGRLIKLANSVLFGGGREKARDLSSAILRLGIKMILDLAYTIQLPNMFSKFKSFDQFLFWKHSLAVACLTQGLAQKADLSYEEKEESYVCGLMHDLGIVVFGYLIPEEYKNFVASAKIREFSLELLEREQFGISHPELGSAFIQKQWPVSPTVIQAVKEHHDPFVVNGSRPTLSQIVHIANQVANAHGITHGIGLPPTWEIDDTILKFLGLSQEEFEKVLERTLEGLDSAETAMKG